METVIGRIEALTENKGSTNGNEWTNYVVVINNKRYGTFNADLLKNFKIGDIVEVDLEQKGKYKQMLAVRSSTQKVSSQASETQNNEVSDVIKGILINRTERANSYEFGRAGHRFKLYFEDVADLQERIAQLKEAGLYSDELPTGDELK